MEQMHSETNIKGPIWPVNIIISLGFRISPNMVAGKHNSLAPRALTNPTE